MSAFTIFNNGVHAPSVAVRYIDEHGVEVTANVAPNERRVTKGIQLVSVVAVRHGDQAAQHTNHNHLNERVLEITNGPGPLLGLNWLQA